MLLEAWMMISEDCRFLLSKARRFGPLYGDRLASHLPMGLIALDWMGAGRDDLHGFFIADSAKLERIKDTDRLEVPRLGHLTVNHFPGLAQYFSDQIHVAGIEKVTQWWIPQLMPGVAASAFHALIRLAYGLESGDPLEVAHALAFWAVEFLELDLPKKRTSHSLDQIACALSLGTRSSLTSDGIIVDKIRRMAANSALLSSCIQPESLALADIAAFSLDAYSGREDFTLLHLVAATHAFRLVSAYCTLSESALRSFWQAILLAYLTVDQRAEDPPADLPSATYGWDELFKILIKCPDVHTIKIGYSAFSESAVYGDHRYQDIVCRRLLTI
jgi:hypothetical protein